MKKIITLILSIALAITLVACGASEVSVDYGNVVDFEAALNAGEDLTDKVVTVSVDKFVPDSAFGYNIQSGEHLNFCSSNNPNVEVGETVTVKIKEVTSVLGSYIINYEMLKKEQSNNAETQNKDTAQNKQSKLLPIEVKEFGYSMQNEYVYYSVNIYNPNENKAIEFPVFRITARNDAGELLATEEQTLSIIYPQQNFVYASQAFDVDEVPANVEIDVLEPKDYQIRNVSTLDNPEYIPLDVINTTFRTDRIVGEIQNNNDYDLDSAVVTVIFRDDNGKLVGGTSTFVDSLKANSTTPFDISIHQEFVTDNFEVYANIW